MLDIWEAMLYSLCRIPYYIRLAPRWSRGSPDGRARGMVRVSAAVLFLVIVATLAAGCDSDLDRQVHRAQINEAFRSACLPASDERVIVQWREGILICARAPTSYKRRVGNTPAIVAHAEDVK
jgi:hypothetical protein